MSDTFTGDDEEISSGTDFIEEDGETFDKTLEVPGDPE
jgi:hypothetical protein